MEILPEYVAVEMLDSMDLNTLAEQLKKVDAQRAQAKAFRESIASGHAGVSGSAFSSAAAAGAHDKGKLPKQILLHTAKQFAPPHTVLFHCHLTHRIRGYYCFGGARPSRGCLLAHGQDTACRVVLQWLWEKHVGCHPGVEIPYDFSLVEEGDIGAGAQSAGPKKAARRVLRVAGAQAAAAAAPAAAAPPEAGASSLVAAPPEAGAQGAAAAAPAAAASPAAKKPLKKWRGG